ncbi:RHOMBOID-like protein [Mycena kentingensis (nom. inval.)]|nr:RHOMBOID-like protein [Mycena kentingensis (nom. inval.)]
MSTPFVFPQRAPSHKPRPPSLVFQPKLAPAIVDDSPTPTYCRAVSPDFDARSVSTISSSPASSVSSRCDSPILDFVPTRPKAPPSTQSTLVPGFGRKQHFQRHSIAEAAPSAVRKHEHRRSLPISIPPDALPQNKHQRRFSLATLAPVYELHNILGSSLPNTKPNATTRRAPKPLLLPQQVKAKNRMSLAGRAKRDVFRRLSILATSSPILFVLNRLSIGGRPEVSHDERALVRQEDVAEEQRRGLGRRLKKVLLVYHFLRRWELLGVTSNCGDTAQHKPPPTTTTSCMAASSSYMPLHTNDAHADYHIPQDEAFNPHAIPEKNRAYTAEFHDDEERAHGYDRTSNYYDHAQEPSYTKSLSDPHAPDASLVHNAAKVSGNNYQDMDYAEPGRGAPPLVAEKAGPLARFMGSGQSSSLQQRIDMKKRGVGRQTYPYLVWLLTAAMVGVFIYELVANKRAQGNPLSFKPVVNYMLGPSSTVLINVGARFPPCMKLVTEVPPTMQIGCLNNTANPATEICSIEDICGFGGFKGEDPNQWFRFFTPIFLHAGIIHLLLNMIAQLTVSAQVEREMGSAGFFFVYFAAGIFGNVLGANFALVGRPSVGASGAIFGTVAVSWVDLFAHWKYHYRPSRKLAFMTIELIIGVAIGYIPYVDNFAHLGGKCVMALFVGMVFYPIISESKRHKTITIGLRIAAIPVAVILFVLLTRNFYTSDPYAACEGCRYLSCFPTASNNHCKGTGLTTSS